MIFCFAITATLPAVARVQDDEERARPNVIVVLTDDQGYGDIAAHGNPEIETPNMDQLHAESVRLTNFHVDPTCAPTRAAIMTGKYSHRVRVWHTVRGGNHLRRSEVTMADVFRHNGYATAMFGKWHLGANYPYRPMDRGFDEWLGLGDGGVGTSDDYFWNDRVNDTYWHNGEREYREGFNTDVLFDAAIEFATTGRSRKPFFIYLATYTAHKPCAIPDRSWTDKYIRKGVPLDRALFYASIERIDWNLGRLRQALASAGIADNTIVIFMTDNGSTHGRTSFNAGMSGGKGSNAEGGHRVPCFIHWPGGSIGLPRDVVTLAAHIDLLPTLVSWCSLQLPKPIDFDGKSLTPILRPSDEEWPDRTLFVEGQRAVRYEKGARSAVMTQRWRLLGLKALYDMDADPGQKHDVAAQYPHVVERLRKAFDQYWQRVTPDDRSFPAPIVGTLHDREIFLSISELRDSSGFGHGWPAAGKFCGDVWHVEIAEAGTYEFEVRRWPREADGSIRGVPTVFKTVDSWDTRPKTHLLYSSKFVPLAVAKVAFKVGDFEAVRSVAETDQAVTFRASLPAGHTTVDARFLAADGSLMTKAYYVYVRRVQKK